MSANKAKRKIFFRSGAIGDIIHCLPTLKLAKEKDPNTSIEFVIASAPVKDLLLQQCDFIDKVHVVKRQINQGNEELLASFKNEAVDEFIYLHSNWWKAWIWNWRFIKAKKILCYKKDLSVGARENFALTCFPELKQDLQKDPFKVLDYKVLVNGTQATIHNNQKYICIVPGVGGLRPHRAYPLKLWLKFIEQVLVSSDLNIKILGGPDEKDISDKIDEYIKEHSHSRIENIIGKTSLTDLVSILSSAKHLYSGDTGLLHITSALDIPTSSVFSISSEERTGPFSPKATVLRSSNCKCNPDMSNSRKTCSYLQNGYASCLQSLNFELIQSASGTSHGASDSK